MNFSYLDSSSATASVKVVFETMEHKALKYNGDCQTWEAALEFLYNFRCDKLHLACAGSCMRLECPYFPFRKFGISCISMQLDHTDAKSTPPEQGLSQFFWMAILSTCLLGIIKISVNKQAKRKLGFDGTLVGICRCSKAERLAFWVLDVWPKEEVHEINDAADLPVISLPISQLLAQ